MHRNDDRVYTCTGIMIECSIYYDIHRNNDRVYTCTGMMIECSICAGMIQCTYAQE